MGSSTFVMASIDHQEPVMYSLNLGDSGFMIIRPSSNLQANGSQDLELIY
jgi:hypothetical protein